MRVDVPCTDCSDIDTYHFPITRVVEEDFIYYDMGVSNQDFPRSQDMNQPVNDKQRYEPWNAVYIEWPPWRFYTHFERLSNTNTMTLPSGIYRITKWGSHDQPQVLTLQNGLVTVLPPDAAPEQDQEVTLWHAHASITYRCLQWRVEVQEDGKVAIQNPAKFFPSRSFSYEGEAERGKRIIPGPLSDFPTRFWRVEPAPQLPFPVPYLSVCNPSTLLV